MQLKGIVKKVFVRKETGWIAASCVSDRNEPVKVIGVIPHIDEGKNYCFEGEWSLSQEYGKRFKADRAAEILPVTRAGIISYLSSGMIRGLGEKTAKKIVDHFGSSTISILDNNPERLLEVSGIQKKKLKTIIEDWSEASFQRNTMMFLSSLGISPTYAVRIMQKYMFETSTVVRQTPYKLAYDIHGIGFKIADSIARQVGIKEDSIDRVQAAIRYFITTMEEDGHCYVYDDQIRENLVSILELSEDRLVSVYEQAIRLLLGDRVLVEDKVDGKVIYYRGSVYHKEVAVAEKLRTLLRSEFSVDFKRVDMYLEEFCRNTNLVLSQEQEQAVREALTSKVFILTGGPGVGKTTTANAIISVFKMMGKSVTLAAPTGRAAKRLTEVSGEEAKTIHRLLEWNPASMSFNYNKENRLASKVVILDESSMIDLSLAYALLTALPDEAQIIFIGDKDQLPSVGAGNFFKDIIESGAVPCIALRKIFRQASFSDIIKTAHKINNGERVEFVDDPQSDCRFVSVEEPWKIKEAIKILVSRKLPEQYEINPLEDIEILSPMKKGEIGVENLNLVLREILNPKEKSQMERRGLRLNDKVIQCSNNYNLGVFNGDIGYVSYIKSGVELGNIEQSINQELSEGVMEVKDKKNLYIKYQERTVAYSDGDLDDIKLAYAITIHKSQGSEFPVVIIPVSHQHHVMLERNLFYTAITRARKLVVFVGTAAALNYAISNISNKLRQTRLKYRLLDRYLEVLD